VCGRRLTYCPGGRGDGVLDMMLARLYIFYIDSRNSREQSRDKKGKEIRTREV
jgi:hypothetical protein